MAEIVNGFIQARNYQPSNRTDPSVIVIHRGENALAPGTAIAMGRYFSTKNAPEASAHYGCDPEHVIQYVLEKDIAFGAPGMNKCSIHIEHAGWSKDNDWDSEMGLAMLNLSAQLSADICSRNAIALKWLSDQEIRSASKGDVTVRGFCTHADVTRALATSGGHTDPGSAFPRGQYLQLVQSHLVV